jgi:flagellar motor switch/type III secretory pathway protein FliN
MPLQSMSLGLPKVSSHWATCLSPLSTLQSSLRGGVEEVVNQGALRTIGGLKMECGDNLLFIRDMRINDYSVMSLFLRAPREHLQQYLRSHLASLLGEFANTLRIADSKGAGEDAIRYVVQVHNHVTGMAVQVAFDMTGSCPPIHLLSRSESPLTLADLPHIRLSTSTVLDTFTLDSQELYSLEPGDVLISKLHLPSDLCMSVKVGGLINTLSSQIRLDKHGIQFCFNLSPQIERNIVTHTDVAESFSTPDLSEPITGIEQTRAELGNAYGARDDLVVKTSHHWRLDCVLQGPTLELRELLSIHAGNVLELTQKVDYVEVDLRLDSQTVARGQLIDIEGRLGIRIVKSYLPECKTSAD